MRPLLLVVLLLLVSLLLPSSFGLVLSRPRLHVLKRQSTRQLLPTSTLSMTSTSSPSTNEGPTGVFNALGASSKFIVSSIAAVVLFTSTESWSPMFYILAAVTNGVLSKVIKNSLKIPRPVESKKNGYGMPSSHAQSFFFFLTALAVNHDRVFRNRAEAAVVCTSIAVYSVVAAYWRVVTKLHSTTQTVVGAVLGTLVALSAARVEVSGIRQLRSVFSLVGGGDADDAIWVAKLCITVAAALVICKREITALTEGLFKSRRRPKPSAA